MNAEDEWTFKAYRDRTREGIPRRSLAAEAADARALFGTLAGIGGEALVGPLQELDPGLYYQAAPAGD
jgi:NitT/TauT family transport system substrate-binding protein